MTLLAIPAIALVAALWCAIPHSGRAAPAITFIAATMVFALLSLIHI